MHSKIIQIETSPLKPDDYITEDSYIGDHWFVYRIADYVENDGNREDSIEQFRAALSAGSPCIDFFASDDGEGFILHEDFLNNYFASAFREFMDAMQILAAQATPSAFADGSLRDAISRLETTFDDKYDVYVECAETGLVTLSKFLRSAKTGTRYYLGGTVDYHY